MRIIKMPVVLKTQRSFHKSSPWSNFTFQHELPFTPETKAPKFQVKYDLVKRNFESVATVIEPTTYVPLTRQSFNAVVTPVKMESKIEAVQTEPIDIKQEPEFLKTVTGIAAYERAMAQEEISKIEKQKAMSDFQANFVKDFLNTFLYTKFKVPPEMAEDLNLIIESAKRVEGSVDKDGKFVLRKDSEYNKDIEQQLNDWLDVAVASGIQTRQYTIDDISKEIEEYFNSKLRPLKRKRQEPFVFGDQRKKVKIGKPTDKSKVSHENILLTKKRKGKKV
jgi:hypothetical protein